MECKDAPSSSPPPSFPSEFLQSFSYKSENEVSHSSEGSTLPSRRRTRSSQAQLKASHEVQITPIFDAESNRDVKRVKKADSDTEDKPVEHLPEVPDHIKEDVDILIIGSNPGRMSSRKCQHFSHPSNHFYRALHLSNLTPVQVPPSEDYTLIHQSSPYFSLGLTNLVARPTRFAQDLNKTEEALGTEILIDLIRKYRPKVGIFVGIGVSRSFERSVSQLRSLKKEEPQIKAEEEVNTAIISVAKEVPLVSDKNLGLGVGLMSLGIRHSIGDGVTLLFAMPSTSGRVTTHQLKEKAASMSWARVLTSQLGKFADDCIDDSRHQVVVRLI